MEDANKSFKDIDAIAVTNGPGLMGSLLSGISFAKGISQALNIPIIPINHLEACLLYTSPSPRDKRQSRMPSSA